MTLKNDHLLQQGRYQIRDHLGQGGMGTVYLAEDLHLSGRFVAIKENTDAAREVQVQFEREAITLARLSHPNLPRVTDHFVEPSGRQYLVMDYVQGDDLRQLLQEHAAPFPEKVVLAWIEQVMDALDYMHHWVDPITKKPAPIVHRDIKPGNIKQTPDGRIVLVDFGLAKSGETTVETLQGARAVTPGYSPIEQYTGGTSTRSDIYALGATLYTLTTGQRPLEAPTLAAGTTLPLPRKLNPALSRITERVILRAMQLQPAERYSSVREMRAALLNKRQTKRLTEKPLTAFTPAPRQVTPVQRFPAWWSRSFTIGLGLLLILLITGGVTALFASAWMTQWLDISLRPASTSTWAVAMAPADTRSAATDNSTASEEVTATYTSVMTTPVSATADQPQAAASITTTSGDELTWQATLTTTLQVTAPETVTAQATFTSPALSTTRVTRTTPSTRAATSTALPTHTATAPHSLGATATLLPTATPSATMTPTPQPTAPPPSPTPTRNQTAEAAQTRQEQLVISASQNATLTARAPAPTATLMPQPTNTMIQTLRPTATPSPELTVQAVQTALAYETLEQRVFATLTARAPTATPTAKAQPTATRVVATATATATTTPMPQPTATPLPTATVTPPNTNTPPSTNTPLPTNTAPPTPLATATPVLPVGGALTLLEPTDVVLKGRRIFRWSTDVTLAENQYFELVFWPAGREAMGSGFGPAGSSKETTFTVDLDKTADTLPNLFQSGQDYEWGVLLVELNPYRRLQYLGGGHRFRFERSSGGGGGGSAPAPTNTPRG